MKFAGTDIKESKHVVIGLQSIYGIGETTSKKILQELGIQETKKVKDLSFDEQAKITEKLDQYLTGSELKKQIHNNIKKYVMIRNLRGMRHQGALPVRGQRTKTNGRTARRLSFFTKRGQATVRKESK